MNSSIFNVPVAFFGFLAFAVVGQAWIRHRSRIATLRVISEAAAKGAPLDPILVERLLAKPKPAAGKWFGFVSLVLGVCFLCIGLALSVSQMLRTDEFGIGPIVNLSLGSGLTTLGIVMLRLYSGRWRPAPQWDYPAGLALACLMIGTMGMSIGTALALGSAIGYDDMTTGALVTGFSGVGLIILGTVILRLFGQVPES
jgi:hypothetical protein